MLKPLLAAFAAASVISLGACEQNTTVERDSELENAMEDAGNDLENAADDAGDALEQAGDDAADAVDDATDGDPTTNP